MATDYSRPNLVTPSVHLNGTGRQELLDQYQSAIDDLRKAIDAVAKSAPHARDYYVQSSTAIVLAMRQHAERLQALDTVLQQLNTLAEAVYRQGRH